MTGMGGAGAISECHDDEFDRFKASHVGGLSYGGRQCDWFELNRAPPPPTPPCTPPDLSWSCASVTGMSGAGAISERRDDGFVLFKLLCVGGG